MLVSLHGLLLVGLYQKFGLNILQEGDKYLTEAQQFLNGNFHQAFEYQTFYSSYILYLALFKCLSLPYIFIFISTYLLSLVAYYFFYQLIKELMGNPQSKLWLGFMLLSPLVQYWQFSLFSETFYIALSLMYCYVLFYNQIKNRLMKVVILSIILIFSRPSGVFTVGILLGIYFYINRYLSKKVLLSLGFIAIISLLIGVVYLMPLHYNGFAKDIAMGAIYCGFPTLLNPVLPTGNYTLWQCYEFTSHNHGVGVLFELFFKKFNSFFITTRPYYTSFHNLINAIHYVFYPLSIYGIYSMMKQKSIGYYVCIGFSVVIFLSALMVGLIFNEWSERHTVLAFPFIFLLASQGIVTLLGLFGKQRIQRHYEEERRSNLTERTDCFFAEKAHRNDVTIFRKSLLKKIN